MEICEPALRTWDQQKNEPTLSAGKGERVEPQLTCSLEKDILLACPLQMFPLESKKERENVSYKKEDNRNPNSNS